MTDAEKKAEIDAEYMRAIRELMATKDPWLKLSAILSDSDTSSAQRGRAEAVAIEKLTIPGSNYPRYYRTAIRLLLNEAEQRRLQLKN